MATVPNPRTWAPSDIATAAQFNLDIRDAINFLIAPPRVQARSTVDQTLVPETWAVIAWNTTVSETDGASMHVPGGSNSRLVAQTAGRYLVFVTVRWDDHTLATGSRLLAVERNAAGVIGAGDRVAEDRRHSQDNFVPEGQCNQCASATTFLSVGQYVEAFAQHDQDNLIGSDNSDLLLSYAASSRFGMIWISEL